MSNESQIYFVSYADAGRTTLTVIDLDWSVTYERGDFRTVDCENFHNPEDAIKHARALAKKYGLHYLPFSSRYNSDLNEKANLTLDDSLATGAVERLTFSAPCCYKDIEVSAMPYQSTAHTMLDCPHCGKPLSLIVNSDQASAKLQTD